MGTDFSAQDSRKRAMEVIKRQHSSSDNKNVGHFAQTVPMYADAGMSVGGYSSPHASFSQQFVQQPQAYYQQQPQAYYQQQPQQAYYQQQPQQAYYQQKVPVVNSPYFQVPYSSQQNNPFTGEYTEKKGNSNEKPPLHQQLYPVLDEFGAPSSLSYGAPLSPPPYYSEQNNPLTVEYVQPAEYTEKKGNSNEKLPLHQQLYPVLDGLGAPSPLPEGAPLSPPPYLESEAPPAPPAPPSPPPLPGNSTKRVKGQKGTDLVPKKLTLEQIRDQAVGDIMKEINKGVKLKHVVREKDGKGSKVVEKEETNLSIDEDFSLAIDDLQNKVNTIDNLLVKRFGREFPKDHVMKKGDSVEFELEEKVKVEVGELPELLKNASKELLKMKSKLNDMSETELRFLNHEIHGFSVTNQLQSKLVDIYKNKLKNTSSAYDKTRDKCANAIKAGEDFIKDVVSDMTKDIEVQLKSFNTEVEERLQAIQAEKFGENKTKDESSRDADNPLNTQLKQSVFSSTVKGSEDFKDPAKTIDQLKKLKDKMNESGAEHKYVEEGSQIVDDCIKIVDLIQARSAKAVDKKDFVDAELSALFTELEKKIDIDDKESQISHLAEKSTEYKAYSALKGMPGVMGLLHHSGNEKGHTFPNSDAMLKIRAESSKAKNTLVDARSAVTTLRRFINLNEDTKDLEFFVGDDLAKDKGGKNLELRNKSFKIANVDSTNVKDLLANPVVSDSNLESWGIKKVSVGDDSIIFEASGWTKPEKNVVDFKSKLASVDEEKKPKDFKTEEESKPKEKPEIKPKPKRVPKIEENEQLKSEENSNTKEKPEIKPRSNKAPKIEEEEQFKSEENSNTKEKPEIKPRSSKVPKIEEEEQFKKNSKRKNKFYSIEDGNAPDPSSGEEEKETTKSTLLAEGINLTGSPSKTSKERKLGDIILDQEIIDKLGETQDTQNVRDETQFTPEATATDEKDREEDRAI